MKGMAKKAEMGIGTLIIFIALLLVAAVAAGVLIQTAGSLQERALTTGDQAKGQISTNVRMVEVSATDGQDGDLDVFEQIAKLSPGSNAIKLEQTLLTANTYDRTASLTYRGNSGTFENNFTNGYYTLTVETLPSIAASNVTLSEDYDLDGLADSAAIVSNQLVFSFSGGNTYTVPIANLNCTDNSSIEGSFTVSGSDEIASISASGSCTSGALSTDAVVNVTPKKLGEGFFTVEYLQRGTNPVDGNLQTGDVIKIYYEAPREVQEDEEVRINFIPKIGTPTLTQFITPEVISTQRVYLYP